MFKSYALKVLGLLVVLSMFLAACGSPTAAPATAAPATSAPATAAPATAAPATVAPAELPTLDIYFVGYTFKDEDMAAVTAAANEILAKDIGAKIALHQLGFTDGSTKVNLMMNSGENCDLVVFGNFVAIQPAISAGGIIPLEDLLPKYAPTEWGNFTQQAWDSKRQKDGHIYEAMNLAIGGVKGAAAFWVARTWLTSTNSIGRMPRRPRHGNPSSTQSWQAKRA
jgi:putative aldouronate transport system substrate-binding protein